MKYLIPTILLLFILKSSDIYFSNNKEVKLTKIFSNNKEVDNDSDYYRNERNITLGVNNTLLVKLKSINNLDSYLEEFQIRIVKNLGDNIYLLETLDKNLTIYTSAELYKKEDVILSHPNFIKRSFLR